MNASAGVGPSLFLVRHGETAWSLSGQHTGHSDIPLTAEGRHVAAALKERLARERFAAVFSSPLSRARDTAAIAGFTDGVRFTDDLKEWDYGADEGRTRAEIVAERPGWDLWRDGVKDGESIQALGARADRVLAQARAVDGDVALFAHGHVLRVIAARFLGLPPDGGRLFTLGVASVSVLGTEWGRACVQLWNDRSHLQRRE